jgi:hypothetical protein
MATCQNLTAHIGVKGVCWRVVGDHHRAGRLLGCIANAFESFGGGNDIGVPR